MDLDQMEADAKQRLKEYIDQLVDEAHLAMLASFQESRVKLGLVDSV